MAQFHSVLPESFDQSAFRMIGREWMLITAQKPDGTVNTMTASWGGMGVLWRKNVAFAFIRPQRFTKEFVDAADTFSLCFLDESWRKALGYLGSASGRDEPKIEKAGLTVVREGGTPYFEQSRTVLLCKKLYAQAFSPECFVDSQIDADCYPDHDHHIMYVGEVTEILSK